MLHILSLFKRRKIVFVRQEAALIAVSAVWGGTFLAVKHGLTVSGPLFFIGARFTIATVLVAMLTRPALRRLNRHEIAAGAVIGVAIFVGYILQTMGLQTISSSKSAFMTALYVPVVPILQWIILRRRPHLMSWIGIALAFSGLILLAGPRAGSIDIGRGEVLTLAGAVSISLEIVLISLFAGKLDARRVTVVQLGVVAILAWAILPLTGEPLPAPSWTLVLVAGGLGATSAAVQLIMNWAQEVVSPTRATIIYAGEPVSAGIVGRIAGDRLPALALAGAVLIVTGVLVSEMKRRRNPSEDLPEDLASAARGLTPSPNVP